MCNYILFYSFQMDDHLNQDDEPASHNRGGGSAQGEEEDDDTDSTVLKLTDANFEEVVEQSTNADVFVEFYAPWCGHCQQLKPEYKRTAKAFDEVGYNIYIVEVVVIITEYCVGEILFLCVRRV